MFFANRPKNSPSRSIVGRFFGRVRQVGQVRQVRRVGPHRYIPCKIQLGCYLACQ